ncbi:MAG: metalloregulator ArsR/SmtB family transcription factor [Gemmatimonadales bacterium]
MLTTQSTALPFKALGDATRLRILDIVAGGEKCVCDLVAQIDVPQPLLSHHLRILREAGLVTHRKQGRWSYYALDREGLEACRCVIEEALATYDHAAEQGVPGCAC